MPFRPPALDDRNFDDLVNELLARIPAHTPEWTNPRLGDPGRTLIELFAWLGDSLLYRANLIPERQRLAFLRLLGVPMRAAVPARTVVTVRIDDENQTKAVTLPARGLVKGPVNFETRDEVTVLPISAEGYYKRRLSEEEDWAFTPLKVGLQSVYQLGDDRPELYVTTPVFTGGALAAEGFDLVKQTVDRCLWLALLAPQPELVAAVRETLGKNATGGRQWLNVGVVPLIATPPLFAEIGARAHIPHLWEISAFNSNRQRTEYHALDLIADTTAGLTQQGVQRLALPAAKFMSAASNDVRTMRRAGVGDEPPRLDDPEKAARLVAWLRLRPAAPLASLALSWIGINAVEIDQRQTLTGRIVGQSDGGADQSFQLPAQSVESETLQLQVEESGRGFVLWTRIDDLALAGRDDAVYTLDSEAGLVRFGDGLRGRVPEVGARIRVALMRAGGGSAGNLPPGVLSEISARDLSGAFVTNLKVTQPLPTEGGEDPESLAAAEQRVPALFRHRDRAVTVEDYKRLAADTPGVRLGRIEVMPRFRPQQRQENATGVVAVMVLPVQPTVAPPNPRPDRPLLESVHGWLDARRPLATELYVIGCEYVPLGVSVGITINEGFGYESVLNEVREALRHLLWPLVGSGPAGAGWPLGSAVRDRELEVSIARVAGVRAVRGVNLFVQGEADWQMIPRLAGNPFAPQELHLERWQLPELLSVVVVADADPPSDLSGVPNPFASERTVAVPVVPEVCY